MAVNHFPLVTCTGTRVLGSFKISNGKGDGLTAPHWSSGRKPCVGTIVIYVVVIWVSQSVVSVTQDTELQQLYIQVLRDDWPANSCVYVALAPTTQGRHGGGTVGKAGLQFQCILVSFITRGNRVIRVGPGIMVTWRSGPDQRTV